MYKAGTTSGGVTSVNGDTGPAVVLTAADLSAIPTSEKGTTNGVATLNASGKVPLSQLPVGRYIQIESVREGAVPPSGVEVGGIMATQFDGATDQDFIFELRIPQDYTVGTQIFLGVTYAIDGTAGTVDLSLDVDLYDISASAVLGTPTDTGNDTAALAAPGVANTIETVVMDVTTVAGLVGAVALAAGDILKLTLSRLGSTDTSNDEFNLINLEARY